MNRFLVRDKGFGKYNLFVPGWATGTEIFENVKPGHDHIYVQDFDPFTFTKDGADFLAVNGIKKISLTGFSMGAAAVLHSLDVIGTEVENVELVGLRKSYSRETIDNVRLNLTKNKEAFLYRFYSDMFSPSESAALAAFKAGLMKKYTGSFSVPYLLSGLDYLQHTTSGFCMGNGTRVKFIYGSADRILSAEEVDKYRKEADNIEGANSTVSFDFIEGGGHAPFIKDPGILK